MTSDQDSDRGREAGELTESEAASPGTGELPVLERIHSLEEQIGELLERDPSTPVTEQQRVQDTIAELTLTMEEVRELDARLRRRTEELLGGPGQAIPDESRFRAVFENLPEAVVVTSTAGVVLAANIAAEALLRASAADLAGRPLSDLVLEECLAELSKQLDHVAKHGRAEWTLKVQPGGEDSIELQATVSPVARADGDDELVWVVRPVRAPGERGWIERETQAEMELGLAERAAELEATNAWIQQILRRERGARIEADRAGQELAVLSEDAQQSARRLEATVGRLRTQYAVQRGLSEADSLAEAAPKILDALGESSGWDFAAMWVLAPDGSELECLAVWTGPGLSAERFKELSEAIRFTPGTGLPGGVWATGDHEWMPDVVNEPRFARPELASEAGLHGAVAFPAKIGTEVVAVFELFSRDRRHPDEDLIEMLAALGQEVGQFVRRKRSEEDRARLLEAERAARAAAEAARERLSILAEASDALASSFDYESTLEAVARLVTRRLADYCFVDVVEEEGKDQVRRVAVASRDPGNADLLEELRRRPPGLDRPNHPAVRAINTGEPQLIEHVSDEVIRAIAVDPEHERVLRALDPRTALVVSIQSRQGVTGTITMIGSGPSRPYDQEDVEAAMELARRAAMAVDNARLYESEQWTRRGAERSAERTAALQRVTSALAGALSPEEVARVIIEQGCATTGATSAWVALLDPRSGSLDLLRATGYADDLVEQMRSVSVDDDLPLSESVRDRRAIFVSTAAELDERYPHLAPISGELGRGALAALPLMGEAGPLGGVLFGFARHRRFDPQERTFLRALIQQGAQALERSRLYEQERWARAEAEAAELRLGFLLEASTVLSSSLDYPATLEGVGRVAVSAIADICLMDMLMEDGSIERLVAVHADPTKQPLTDELKKRFAPDPAGPHPAVRVMRTGRPEIIPEMSEEFLRATTRDEEHYRITRELEFNSYMCVPLIARGRNLGTITLVRTQGGRPYDDDDLALAEELAIRAALATDNARLYRERDRWARALQSALLPPEIPDVPGVDVAARYRPAGEGNEIGGDFFDIFWTRSGWALVVGDVQGKGPDAAAVMGLIRHSIRAAAMQDPSPARVLHVVNDALRRQDRGDRFATVSFIRLEAAGAGVRLTACSAGHPLPVIVQRDGTLRGAGEPGTLLGVFAEPQLEDRSSALSPGDTVVMYTDGVTERRSGSALFGEQRLRTLLSSLAGSTSAEIADRIEREVQAFGPEGPKDDIAILVVRIADWGVAGEPPS